MAALNLVQTQVASDAGLIQDLGAFLARFRVAKQNQRETPVYLEQFLRGFEKALPRLTEEEDKWQRTTAPRFNVFRVLQLERKETKLHSRFIGELLDPSGSHGQRDTFLRTFFSVDEKVTPSPSWGKPKDWKVSLEEAVGCDRFDIVLRGPDFIAVIENKVDALEQPEQLERYYQWLYRQHCSAKVLIFLTVEGREPKSICKEHRDFCLCLSYKQHVLRWLQGAMKEGIAPIVRDTLNQYLQVVTSL